MRIRREYAILTYEWLNGLIKVIHVLKHIVSWMTFDLAYVQIWCNLQNSGLLIKNQHYYINGIIFDSSQVHKYKYLSTYIIK